MIAKNYKEMSDFDLVILYRKNDYAAQEVLVKRYRIYSVALARELHEAHKGSSKAEFQDLVSIGIISLDIAVKSFDTSSPTRVLYPYWKTIATNEMMEYIMQYSYYKNGELKIVSSPFFDFVDAQNAKFSSANEGLLYSELIDFLADPKYYISKRDQEIFSLYIAGLSFSELAKKYSLSYNTVKKIVNRIRKLVIKYLL